MALNKKPAYHAEAPALTLKGNRKLDVSKWGTEDGIIRNNTPTPVLVLECMKEDWITANAIYCLERDRQWAIHLVSFNNTKSSFRHLPYLKSYRQFPEENGSEQFLDFLRKVVTETKALVLVPTNTASCQFVLQNKECLQQFIRVMPVPQPWAYTIAGDKGMLANFMFENAIPGPLTLFDLTDNLKGKLDNFPFPVLLKPKKGSGGKGVTANEPPITLFTNKEELLAFINQHQIADRYVVQSFVKGYEIDCNVLYKEGKLIAYCIQRSLVKADKYAPSFGLEFIHNEKAIAIVDALMSKLKWNGVAHIDLMYDSKKRELQILEINPRFWQTMVGSMMGANINFPSLACTMALDRPIAHIESKVGKYIPLIPYLKHQLTAAKSKNVQFTYNEIDIRYFFAMLPAKALRSYRHLLHKWLKRRSAAVEQAGVVFWCAFILSYFLCSRNDIGL